MTLRVVASPPSGQSDQSPEPTSWPLDHQEVLDRRGIKSGLASLRTRKLRAVLRTTSSIGIGRWFLLPPCPDFPASLDIGAQRLENENSCFGLGRLLGRLMYYQFMAFFVVDLGFEFASTFDEFGELGKGAQ
jgi:hypothetical protein